MVVKKLEQSFLDDVIEATHQELLTPATLSMFKEGSLSDLLKTIHELNYNEAINIESLKEYDAWYNKQLIPFHRLLYPL